MCSDERVKCNQRITCLFFDCGSVLENHANYPGKRVYFVSPLVCLLRNRRSGQSDRLSGVSVTLHYGSESEDDPVLSGESSRL